MARANRRVQSAKTYVATWELRTQLGQMAPAVQTMSVLRMPGRKSRISVRETGVLMVDDGKVLYLYSAQLKQYARRPSRILSEGPIGATGTSSQQKYALEGMHTIRGMNCYSIRITPRKLPAGVVPPQVHAYVEAAGFRLVRTVSTVLRPGSEAAPLPLTQTIDVITEDLNTPIDPSVFRFTPPKGAKPAPQRPRQGK